MWSHTHTISPSLLPLPCRSQLVTGQKFTFLGGLEGDAVPIFFVAIGVNDLLIEPWYSCLHGRGGHRAKKKKGRSRLLNDIDQAALSSPHCHQAKRRSSCCCGSVRCVFNNKKELSRAAKPSSSCPTKPQIQSKFLHHRYRGLDHDLDPMLWHDPP